MSVGRSEVPESGRVAITQVFFPKRKILGLLFFTDTSIHRATVRNLDFRARSCYWKKIRLLLLYPSNWIKMQKGLRDRISPTCTLSQNGYGTYKCEITIYMGYGSYGFAILNTIWFWAAHFN